MNSLSEDTSIHVRGGDRSYKLSKLNTSIQGYKVLFLVPPLTLGSLPLFILHLLFYLHPTRRQLMVYTNTCPINPLQKSSGVIVRLKSTVQLVVEHLMRQQLSLKYFQAFLCLVPSKHLSYSTEWSKVSFLMVDHTFSPRHYLAEEGFFPEPLLG